MAPTPMSVNLKTPVKPILARRIDLSAEQLGFSAPPCAVNVKFFPLDKGWAVVALTPPAKPPVVARWLETYGPTTINIAPGLSPKVLRAKFEKVPAAWDQFLNAVVVHYLQIRPDGSASLFIEDSPATVERFVTAIKEVDPKARARKTQTGPSRVKLTARQQEVMSLALALGYYEVPHGLTLRTLAKKVGLSVGAVSELLRRGEALIISHYIDTMSSTQWHSTPEGTTVSTKDPLREDAET